MFYDTSKPLNLDKNEIAESAHFFFPGSLLPTVPGTTPSSPHHTISAGAAGVVGAVVTLAVVAVCLLAYIFCYRKRRRIAENAAVDPGPEESHFKPELEGREYENVASRTQPLIDQEMQVSAAPLPVLSDRSELTAPASARHELYGNTQGYYNPQMPTKGNTSQISRSELQTQSPQNVALPTIKRKEIGGAWQ